MQHAIKTSDLAPEDRAAVERLVGRTLRDDEAVEFVVHAADEVARHLRAAQRAAAVARIEELARGRTLEGLTVRELIDEGRRF